jgi:ribonuclease BN (tRNA processing enzyme)
MQILPLGTCAANRNPYQLFSSYLLEIITDVQKIQILMDLGNKRAADLKYINPDQLKVIFISHQHLDHSLYIGKLIRKLSKLKRKEPLKIIANSITCKVIEKLIKLKNWFKIPSFVELIPSEFKENHRELEKYQDQENINQVNSLEPLIFQMKNDIQFKLSIKITHTIHIKDSVAFRLGLEMVDSTSTVLKKNELVYSPDTKYDSDNLIPFAKDVDYWLLDTTFHKDYIIQEVAGGKNDPHHSSPEHSARLCRLANVKNYVIIHYFWSRFAEKYEDAEQNLLEMAKQEYSGNIIVSKDLHPIIL